MASQAPDSQRVSGLRNSVLGADPLSLVEMEKLHNLLKSEQPCLRLSASESAEGLTVFVAQIVAGASEPGKYTLGVLHFLYAHIKTKMKSPEPDTLLEIVDKTAFFNAVRQFLLDTPSTLFRDVFKAGKEVPNMYADVCRIFAQTAVDLNLCADAIEPLTNASRAVANGEAILTPCHQELIRMCLKSQQLTIVKPMLDTPIFGIHPKNTGLKSKDFLLYFYYGGLAYSAMKEWESAVTFFTQCINTPADCVSSIVVEAHKFWCIVSLFLNKGPAQAQAWKKQPGTPGTVANNLESINKLYVNLNKQLREASENKAGTETKCNTFVEGNVQSFTADHTIGLVRQAQTWIYQRRIQRLTATYLTLSVADIASVVGVEESIVEPSILTMVQDGKIFAQIDQQSSMVSFLENPQTYTGKDSIALMSERMKMCTALAERVANVEAKVVTSSKYIENAVVEDQRKATVAATKVDDGTNGVAMDLDDDMDLNQ
jgi:COP9 signalosome complex subunit 3